jgi:hypothetical protein
MSEDITRLTDFLIGLRIEKIAHSNESFLSHLVGVYRLMEERGFTQELCRAGMFHSIYGTELFQRFALSLDKRPEVRALIGERAECLAYRNCALNRASIDRAIQVEAEPHCVLDRFTGEAVWLSDEDFDDLCRIHLYDWLEQMPRSILGRGYRREAYQRMAHRLGELELTIYERALTEQPTAAPNKSVGIAVGIASWP